MSGKRYSDSLIVEAIERRILYSTDSPLALAWMPQPFKGGEAGGAATMSASIPALTQSITTASQQQSPQRHEIVFIDGAVQNAQELAAHITAESNDARSLEVFVIDAHDDGIARIGQILSQYRNLDAIHIMSHGDDGMLQIGSTRLDNQGLLANSVAISKWGNALTDSGDILLYGCDVAQRQDGRDFVSALGQLTGADVAASTDLTGAASQGGNWTLEYNVGHIETAIAPDAAAQTDFQGVLATYTVTNTNDSGAGSLRQAIMDANANAGTDTINFSIGSGLQTIAPTSALPRISDTVVINGTSQPGYASAPLIELNGTSAGTSALIELGTGAGGSTISGLIINRSYAQGILLNGASNVTIQGNYIGINSAGNAALANGNSGIQINSNSSNNTIGGTTLSSRNVISGNTNDGIDIIGSTGNTVAGNYIGLDAGGTVAIANLNGVHLQNGATGNTVGGTTAAARNIASGNTHFGVLIEGATSTGNVVEGNYAGTNASGTGAVGNGWSGIDLQGATFNTIGGTAGNGNLLSGNVQNGLYLETGSNNNTVQGNCIGLTADGTAALSNRWNGIALNSSSNNTVGGTIAGARNIVSGNSNQGVTITGSGSTGNVVEGNYVGINAAGAASIGNGWNGVNVEGTANTIGGTASGAGNVISGNVQRGIFINGGTGNLMEGNYIGLNAAGMASLANGWSGIEINSGSGNRIGGTTAAARNVVSGNSNQGVTITGSGSTGNVVEGNYVGINAAGTASIGNGWNGVNVEGTANTIGGTASGAGNVISGNVQRGIFINGGTGNLMEGNYIGLNAAGMASLANGWSGIEINNGRGNTIGGTTATARNIIAGNSGDGIRISASTNDVIEGNYIGTTVAGDTALGNVSSGIYETNSSGTVIGGSAAGAGNVISGNGSGGGVQLVSSSGITLQGNRIGINAAGTAAVANSGYGISLNTSSTGNTIGGTTAATRNVISGNTLDGIAILTTSTGNLIEGNYVGLNAAGTAAIGNGVRGIYINADNNTVGGSVAGAGNVVSGNGTHGVAFEGVASGTVKGNTIGLNAAGTAAIGNTYNGVLAYVNANNITIGGATAAERNVISGNGEQGIRIQSSSNAVIKGNYIGLNAAGTAAITNHLSGIYLLTSSGSIVGGTNAGEGNVISGNTNQGVLLSGSTGSVILGNKIGLDAAGTAAIGNGGVGVYAMSASNNNTIGGTAAGAGNVISGNTGSGVEIWDSTGNTLLGNHIGTNAADTAALGNGAVGVGLYNAANSVVGGSAAGSANTISANAHDGINMENSTGVSVKGNYIGTNAAGAVLGNGYQGIFFYTGASNNMIGGTGAGEGNVIANNGYNGISTGGTSVTGNSFLGNSIYNNGYLGIDLGGDGVTANDLGDADIGANNLQNFPVLGSATATATTTTVIGTLNSHAATTYRIEFFSNPSADGSGYGEGKVYLGYVQVTTDGSGNVSFNTTLPVASIRGEWISATATDLTTGDTSEFGKSVQIPINHAPAGTDTTVTALEDGAHTFTAADFGFSDTGDSPADNFQAVVITTLPTAGTLTWNGAAFAAGNYIWHSDIDAGLLKFTPAANANGTGYARFTFQVQDDGGTDNGGIDTDRTPRTMTINVTPVNDAPVGTSNTVSANQGPGYRFTAADFGFSDASDAPVNNFSAVRITTIPGAGTLTDNGVALNAGDFVTKADIDAGKLVFKPAFNASGTGYASFTFQVKDDGGTANGGIDTDTTPKTMTINVVAAPITGDTGTPVVAVPPTESSTSSQASTKPAPQASTSTGSGSTLDGASSHGSASAAPSNAAASQGGKSGEIHATDMPIPAVMENAGFTPNAVAFHVNPASAVRISIQSVEESGTRAAVERPSVINLKQLELLRNNIHVNSAPIPVSSDDGGQNGPESVATENHAKESIAMSTAQAREVAGALASMVTMGLVARKGAVAASMLASLPAWGRLDPLPVLGNRNDDGAQDNGPQDIADHMFSEKHE